MALTIIHMLEKVCYRLVKALYEPYQLFSSSAQDHQHHWRASLKYQTSKLLKDATCLSSDFHFIQASTIMAEAINIKNDMYYRSCTYHSLFSKSSNWFVVLRHSHTLCLSLCAILYLVTLSHNEHVFGSLRRQQLSQESRSVVQHKTQWGDVCMLPEKLLQGMYG